MKFNLREQLKSKTFWLGLSTIVGSAFALYYKQIDVPTAATGIIGGLAMIFVKDAVITSQKLGGGK